MATKAFLIQDRTYLFHNQASQTVSNDEHRSRRLPIDKFQKMERKNRKKLSTTGMLLSLKEG